MSLPPCYPIGHLPHPPPRVTPPRVIPWGTSPHPQTHPCHPPSAGPTSPHRAPICAPSPPSSPHVTPTPFLPPCPSVPPHCPLTPPPRWEGDTESSSAQGQRWAGSQPGRDRGQDKAAGATTSRPAPGWDTHTSPSPTVAPTHDQSTRYPRPYPPFRSRVNGSLGHSPAGSQVHPHGTPAAMGPQDFKEDF